MIRRRSVALVIRAEEPPGISQIRFSLEDIRALLELSSSDCEQVGKLAAQQLNLVRAKLRQLRRIESVLAKTVEQCARRKGNQPCPIIETLSQS